MANDYISYFPEGADDTRQVSAIEGLAPNINLKWVQPINKLIGKVTPREPGYNAIDTLTAEQMPFASHLASTRNPAHTAAEWNRIQDTMDLRRNVSGLSALSGFLVEIPSPENIAPFFVGRSLSLGRRAALGAATAGGIEAAYQYGIAGPTDPFVTADEQFASTAIATVTGGLIGGASAIVARKSAADAVRRGREWLDQVRTAEDLEGVDLKAVPVREDRQHGGLSDEELEQGIRDLEAAKAEGEANLNAGPLEPSPNDRFLNSARTVFADEGLRQLRNERGIRTLEAKVADINAARDPYNLVNNWFYNSPLYKVVSTPLKRAFQSNWPTPVKRMFANLASDQGTLHALHTVGEKMDLSVYMRTAVNTGQIVKVHDEIKALWAADTGANPAQLFDINPTNLKRRIFRSGDDFDTWMEGVQRKAILGSEMSENELKAAAKINDYFENYRVRLEAEGMIGTAKSLKVAVDGLTKEIEDLRARLKTATGVRRGNIQDRLKKLQQQRHMKMVDLDHVNKEAPQQKWFPRLWDKDAIRANREGLKSILAKWYSENPYVYEMDYATGRLKRIMLDPSPEAVAKRADETIDRILGEVDELDPDQMAVQIGRSRHLRSRQLDIPNNLVLDFINTNPMDVIKQYSMRTDPRINFRRSFGGDYDKATFEIVDEMLKSGKDITEANKAVMEFTGLYDQIAGRITQHPDALNQKVAFWLREAAQFTYLGAAGIAALADFGRVVMEYGGKNAFRSIMALADSSRVNLLKNEAKLAGGLSDPILHVTHKRAVDLATGPDAPRWLDNARSAFFVLNGLRPITETLRLVAGVADGHMLIERALKYDSLNPSELAWMARHGIDAEMAKKIADMPWEKSQDGLYYPNTEAWAGQWELPDEALAAIEEGRHVKKTVQNFKAFDAERKAILQEIGEMKRVSEMTDDQLGKWFDYLSQETALKEKVSDPDTWTDAEKAAWESGDWRTFSKLRGYTESDINQYSDFLDVANEYIRRFGVDKAASRARRQSKTVKQKPTVGLATSRYLFARQNEKDLLDKYADEFNLARIVTDQDIALKVLGRKRDKSGYDWLLGWHEEGPDGLASIYVDHEAVRKMYRGLTRDGRTVDQALEDLENARPNLGAEEYAHFKNVLDNFDLFENEDDLIDFIYAHELHHSKVKRKQGESIEDWESRIDQAAMDWIKAARAKTTDSMVDRMAAERMAQKAAEADEIVARFRAALNAGMMNTVLHGTPADVPLISKGVAYIPMRIASRFGMTEDPRVKGYARIENGLMALPFQFYNFLFGSVNKIMGSMATGQVKARTLGAAMMAGIAYMGLQIRTPDYAWEQMSFEDKLMRTLDMSGLTSIYSDMLYTTIHTSLAFGLGNPTGGLISPKYGQKEDWAEGVAGLAGAGPSWMLDTMRGLNEMAFGNFGEGAKDIVRNLPLSNLWFLKGTVNEMSRGWGN